LCTVVSKTNIKSTFCIAIWQQHSSPVHPLSNWWVGRLPYRSVPFHSHRTTVKCQRSSTSNPVGKLFVTRTTTTATTFLSTLSNYILHLFSLSIRDNIEPSADIGMKLGHCESCPQEDARLAKYRCPACAAVSCSLQCVKLHKATQVLTFPPSSRIDLFLLLRDPS
jgi:HIT zinc finger